MTRFLFGVAFAISILTVVPVKLLAQESAILQQIEQQFPSVAMQMRGESELKAARASAGGIEVNGFRAEATGGAAPLPAGVKPEERKALEALAERDGGGRSDSGLQMFYPQFYDEPFVAELGDQRVMIRATGATGGYAEAANGRVTYAGVYRDVDSVHVSRSGRSEEFLLLRSQAAPLVYEYEIVEMRGVSQVVLRDGAVHFLRAPDSSNDKAPSGFGGGAELMIERPWLIDSSGARPADQVRWELVEGGTRLRLLVDAKGLTYPLLIDPTFAPTGSMSSARYLQTATLLPNGKVLVSGGQSANGVVTNTAELYDPASGTFSPAGSMSSARYYHTVTLLPNGKVLVSGGHTGPAGATNTAELYDPASGTFSATGSMSSARYGHTATLLPNGKVLVSGGDTGAAVTNTGELYDPASGAFAATGSMTSARQYHTATLLPDGKVLVAGGVNAAFTAVNTADLYDPASGTFSPAGSMSSARFYHTVTLLPNGKVLVTGGVNAAVTAVNTAELYDPASGTFSPTGSMSSARNGHTATLLPNGKVLVSGGQSANGVIINMAELYDPASGTFSAAGSMSSVRYFHTATLLPNGKVLVSGGRITESAVTNTAELYDPASRTFSATGSMSSARWVHTATLLPNGKVLVSGGYSGAAFLNTAELYDPAIGTFSATGSMISARYGHTATLLPNGKVLVSGGENASGATNKAELYDPASGTFSVTGSMSSARFGPTATLLPDGNVLVSGGSTGAGATNTAEVYDAGLGFAFLRQPVLSSVTNPASLTGSILVSGSGFRGDSEASGGSYNSSATNFPLLQLQRIDSEQSFFVRSDPSVNWTDTSFQSVALSGVSPGHYRVTVITNAIPSLQQIILVNGAPTITTLTSSANPSSFGGSVTFTATVTSGATGTVTFKNGSTTLGSGTISAGSASFNTSALSGGTHSITAEYGGDTNYNVSTSAAVSQVVNKAASTTTLTSSSNPSVSGASVTFTATVTSGATGTVTFKTERPRSAPLRSVRERRASRQARLQEDRTRSRPSMAAMGTSTPPLRLP